MLYLLFVLTFLCGILFYGMSPNDKQLDMTVHQAEGMITSFLSQHQAARDYLYTWLGASSASIGNLQSDSFLNPDFIEMMPKAATVDMCDSNTGVPGFASCTIGGNQEAGFVSRVIFSGSKHYVVTYGGWQTCSSGTCSRPDWWPTAGREMRRFESWRRAIANRTRDSISCGTLYEWNGGWCIDTGKTVFEKENVAAAMLKCKSPVPPDVITSISADPAYLSDMLFCFSEFKPNVTQEYTGGFTRFYDGLSNAGIGQHAVSTPWISLGGETTALCSSNVTFNDSPFVTGALCPSSVPTQIQLDSTYTLTVLAAISDTSCPLLQGDNVVFQKNADEFQLTIAGGASVAYANACNRGADSSGLISWTFVVISNGATQKIDVYENAVKRTPLSNKEISPTSGQNLSLGCTNGKIYGIRYYAGVALSEDQIRRNFKIDQRRFGIADIANGESSTKKCD